VRLKNLLNTHQQQVISHNNLELLPKEVASNPVLLKAAKVRKLGPIPQHPGTVKRQPKLQPPIKPIKRLPG